MTVVPYKGENASKKVQVARMFDSISPQYDFLNHFLSLGTDKRWRKKAIELLRPFKPTHILDVATGTGDFALEAMTLEPLSITGIDISEGMLEKGRKKIMEKGLAGTIELIKGDSENLPFEENKFDAVTVAFGVRNFENLEKGLKEIYRVIKPGGHVVILEFSKPTRFPLKQLYSFYFKMILPQVGRWISKDKAAYSYLPESVEAFPNGEDFTNILRDIGFKSIACKSLTFCVSSIYSGQK